MYNLYKLIAIDLDDTLLTSELQITKRTIDTIQRVRAQGCTITIATGRMYASARKYIKELGIEVESIAYNGAMVVDSLTDKVLIHKSLTIEEAKEVLEIAHTKNVYAQIYIDDECFCNNACEESDLYYIQTGITPKPVGDMRRFISEEPTKVLFIADPKIVSELYVQLSEHFKDRIGILISKPEYLEFINKSASKGIALRELAEKMNISRENVMAFGDSFNDISMIEYAHMGVVMGNAFEEVKSIAQIIAPTNDNDGVAKILEKYVLGEDL